MSARSFWERTWRALDRERLSSYLARFDWSADEIVSFLLKRGARRVCDAGCGCGVFARKLALHGFSVSGFDISEDAVALTKRLLSENGVPTQGFCTADVRFTPYPDGQFDAVVARDVLDHMPMRDGMAAIGELLRIVRPGGCVLLTLDAADSEYESEPHTVNRDGDYLYPTIFTRI